MRPRHQRNAQGRDTAVRLSPEDGTRDQYQAEGGQGDFVQLPHFLDVSRFRTVPHLFLFFKEKDKYHSNNNNNNNTIQYCSNSLIQQQRS